MLSSFHPLRENFILATLSTPSHLSIHFLYPSLLFQVEHTWWNAIAVRRKGSCVVLGHCYSSMETSSDISESHLIPWSCNFVLSYFIIIAPRWSQFPVTFFFPFLYTLFFFFFFCTWIHSFVWRKEKSQIIAFSNTFLLHMDHRL